MLPTNPNFNLEINKPTQSQLVSTGSQSSSTRSGSNPISDIGTFLNLPSLTDTNTAQARQDAFYGETDIFGNVKRGPGSSAYQDVFSTPAYTINGVQYNAAGDPISSNTQTSGAQTSGATGAGSSAGYVDPVAAAIAVRANPLLAAYDALDPAREASRARAQSDYDNMIKQYTDQFATDRQKYQGQVTQNEQNLAGNRQAALLQAAQGGQGLRAILAAMNALNGTGSILADRAISQAANKDIGDAQNSFETNASTLQGAWADTEAQDKQRRAQAQAALEAAFNNADTNFFNNKIDILGKLANVYGADTSQGANYANEAAKLYDTVARIPQGQAVSYTPVSSLYSPQNLARYLAGTKNLQVQTQPGNSQPNSPSIVATTSKRKDELN